MHLFLQLGTRKWSMDGKKMQENFFLDESFTSKGCVWFNINENTLRMVKKHFPLATGYNSCKH